MTSITKELETVEFRERLDAESAIPVLVFLASGVLWLLVGSALGIIASIKLHAPDWLATIPQLTFGRVRPAHLDVVAYGWASLAGVGCLIWLTSRLCKTPIRQRGALIASAALWNLGVLYGTGAVLFGYSQGVEWLEYPLPAAAIIAVAFLLFAWSILSTFHARQAEHLYVSLWYVIASVVWFPILFVVANLPIYSGVEHAAVNWWYGHNALAIWFTPIGLALAYYMIPKVIGRPIYSYYLSLLGFWSFALFYNWNGIHHLVGGPVPTWLQTISIIASVLMVIPVMAVAVNHHMTTIGHFKLLRTSPTLRFTVFGAMCYTAVSFQGSAEALRNTQEVVHFTHYTVGHAHLGVYAFLSMILFGSMYYIIPRVTAWDWPRPGAIRLHFWLAALGISLYFLALTIGGWLQGMAMNNPAEPFVNVVAGTRGWLILRSIGGSMMGLGHLVFAFLFFEMLWRAGPRRGASPWEDAK